MDQQKKKEMGKRVRAWREKRGYSRALRQWPFRFVAPVHRQH